IDIFMTTTALLRQVRIAQACLGAKIHDPKDPGADLGPMFTQVVGTMLSLARRPEAVAMWRAATGSRDVPVIGDVVPVEPEAVGASVPILVEKFRAGADANRDSWRELLSPEVADTVSGAAASGDPHAINGELWPRAVYAVAPGARTVAGPADVAPA